jgi:predicted chitinase
VQGELAILLHNKDRFAQGLHQEVSKFTAQQQELRAKQLALDAPKLFEDFPDLKKPEAQQQLAQYVGEAGLPQEAIEFLNYSAPGVRLAWKARQYDLMVKDQAASRAKLQEKTKTLPAATQSSRAAESGAKDKQLRETWKKSGGKISDPAFDQLLRSKLRG